MLRMFMELLRNYFLARPIETIQKSEAVPPKTSFLGMKVLDARSQGLSHQIVDNPPLHVG